MWIAIICDSLKTSCQPFFFPKPGNLLGITNLVGISKCKSIEIHMMRRRKANSLPIPFRWTIQGWDAKDKRWDEEGFMVAYFEMLLERRK